LLTSEANSVEEIDLIEVIGDAISIELCNLARVSGLDNFSLYMEGYKPESAIYFNPSNIVFTSSKDFEYCSYYNKNGKVLSFSLPTYDIEVYVLSHTGSQLLRDAINYKSV